jgi:3-hydroxyacyl-CoA dehydrogenase / enoyl-CoA hydratase / 3-hydroxybutyryl-CoA epimerase
MNWKEKICQRRLSLFASVAAWVWRQLSKEFKMFQYQKDEDNIGTLKIDMADRSANVINDQFISQFAAKLKEIFSDNTLVGLIITSGKKDFILGGDLEFIQGFSSVDGGLKSITQLQESFRFLETRGKPVIAAINGTVLGGGLELTLACHQRLCLQNDKIQLGLPEVTLGLLPGAGGTQRLPRLIGIQPSLELLTLGTKVSPGKALQLGLLQGVFPDQGAMLKAAKELILHNPVAIQPWDDKKFKIPGGGIQSPQIYQVMAASNAMVADKTFNNYPAPKAILRCVYEGLQVPFEMAMKIEAKLFVNLATSKVAKNMIRTLFFGIQECNKGAARPKDVAAMPVKKVGVLGAGMMGSGIAYSAAKAGISVVLKDISLEAAEKGKAYSTKICEGLIAKGRMTAEQKEELLKKIIATNDPQAVKDCDLIIETVIEDRKIKAKVTQESEEVCAANAVMASNTSTLPITGLAQASKRPDRFIGLHFFSPVDKMPLVEIIMGEKTGKEALAKCIDFVGQLKKTPIVVSDGRGFYTSRVFTTYISEGISLLKEGVLPALIENAGKMAGMPVGPLAVADEVSLDLIYHIMKQTVEDLGQEKVDQNCYAVAKQFVEDLQRLGRKSSGGFYEYPKEGKKFLWPKLAELFPAKKDQPSVDEVKSRLLSIQALETARCLEEGVLHEVRDADVGSILGWGFPAYTGGALSYIDFVGVKKFTEQCEHFAKLYGPRFKPNALLREKAKSGGTFC